MVQTFGNRILGGIGAPESRAGEAFGAGVNTSIVNRTNRQVMDERAQAMRVREEEAARLRQKFSWDTEDRARIAAAYDAFGAPAAGGASGTPPRAGVNVAGLFEKSDVRTQLAPVWTNLESQYKLPAGYLERTAFIESGFNPTARNATSSAGGLFQFIDSTAKQYGLSDKFDPMASSNAAAQLAANNAMYLQRILGRPPTGAELYLAHQQGAGGAAKLLANPNALAVDIVGADAVRNNGGQMDMTAAEFADLWLSKWAGQGPQPYTDRSQRFAPAPGGVQPVVDTTGSSQRFQPMPRQPDQSQRFRPGDYAAALEAPTPTPDTGVRFNPDGTIALPTAPQGRPGGYQAAATAQRVAEYVPPPDTDPFWWLRVDPNAPSGEAMQRILFPQADPMEIRRRLLAEQTAAQTAAAAPPAAAPAEPQVEVQRAGLDTPRPRPRPELTFEQSEDALIAAEQAAAAGATAPAAGVTVPSAGVTVPTGGAAGVVQPGATTADVMQGANVNSVPNDFPGLGALFRDTAALAVERQNLDAVAAALVRQMEFARQTRDAGLMLEADSKLAAINARRSVMGYIAAGNAAMTGNFDPMAEALSEMSGQAIRIIPRSGGTYDLSVDGQVVREGLAGDAMIQQYMYGVNDTYRATVNAARAAEAERAKAYFDAQIEMLKTESAQNAQAGREAYVKAVEAQIAAMGSEFYSERIPYLDGEAIVLYDRKNPSAPVRVISVLPDPANPEATILGQINVNDLRR